MPKQSKKKAPTKSAERRIIQVDYEEITRTVEFKIFALQPDGKRGRVVGRGDFEEQDLERIANELMNLAEDYDEDRTWMQRRFRIEKDEGEDD